LRAVDEVRTWLGDEDSERRRRLDDEPEVPYATRGLSRAGELPARGEARHRDDEWERERRRAARRLARHVMTADVLTVHPGERVERAARLMRQGDCGALPVVDARGVLVGIVTDRDITVRIVASGRDPWRSRVADCMSCDPVACHVDDPIAECLRAMARYQVRRLPVLDERNRLVGIISQGDAARLADRDDDRRVQRAVALAVSEISEPSVRARR
jgi:CBS domain-containing protein